ncbi:MAG: TniQ family protein [[Pasteurella] mairii]|uniref:TniQ domain-containing protein n=1 Tax=[Actinobacillus] rossii TaxID=123820 RepID=A0A380TNV5_9PAST|nr:TniQ family protein [[Actinobacillus] rossii]MDY4280601.1 TniQ family protein [[Pasteurella] mairii]MDD7425236.1 TniQ family protein [[Actinobacillus] rossii]MDY3125032.1 TniQ family protein [[Actinobacillus] rossii]MDY4504942.1 TniQ family protein [[Actinobacillus] rossii]
MGTTNAGLPKNYRIKSGVIRTPIQPNESISSWLIRAALDCGTEPLTFTGFYWDKLRLWTYDLDRGFEPIQQQIYSDICDLSLNGMVNLEAHSLYSALKRINGEQTLMKGQAKWVLPRSSRNRSHRSGQHYCSCCLDEAPYLRNEWRFAWYFGCLKHQTLLDAKCSCCGELYQPHLLSADKRQLNYCHHCGEMLNHHSDLLSETEIEILQTLDTVFTSDLGICFQKQVNSQEYFAILRYFINLIRRGAIVKSSHAIARFLEQLGISQGNLCQPKTALAFELLPIEERKNLLVNAVKILQLSSEAIIYAIQQSEITQKAFAFENYPSELDSLFKHAREGREVNRKTIANKPKINSNLSLNRQWERLKRQLQIAV